MFIKTRQIVPFKNGAFVTLTDELKLIIEDEDDIKKHSMNYNCRNLKLMYVVDDKALGTKGLVRVVPVIFGETKVITSLRNISRSKKTFLFTKESLVRFTGNKVELLPRYEENQANRVLLTLQNLIINNYKINDIDIKVIL